MESKEILEFYQQHQSILQTIYEKKADIELGSFLIFIVDTPDESNVTFILKENTDLIFNNNEELKKLFLGFFKNPPATTPDGKKIYTIFQIHLVICHYRDNTTFIATAESVKAQGFFNKLAGKIAADVWLFWGNLINNQLNVISEEDERLKKLIITNYYREAEEVFYNKTEYKKVEALLVKCLELAPNDPQSLILMGRCKLFLSEFEAAEDIFNKASVLNPKNERAWLGLATAQMEIFKINPRKEHIAYIDAAERNVEKGFEVNPKNVELLNLKSGICMLRMDYTNAEKYLQLALEQKPGDLNTIKNLGLAFLAGGKFNEAIEYLEKALKIKPTDESTVYRIIQCLFELKAEDRAKKMLDAWRPKARNQNWIQDLEMNYMTEIPEELLNDNSAIQPEQKN
jgi:tetratricopeptide (TPR) repeat protein